MRGTTTIRLGKSEMAVLRRAAAALGLPTTTLVRNAALTAAARILDAAEGAARLLDEEEAS